MRVWKKVRKNDRIDALVVSLSFLVAHFSQAVGDQRGLKYMVYMLNGFDVGVEQKGRERTRMLVRIRDKFTCQDCGDIRTIEQAKSNKKRLFDCHHVNGLCGKKSRAYDKVSDIDTMVTLCHKCHYNRPEHKVKQNFGRTAEMDKRDSEIIEIRKYGATLRAIGKEYKIHPERVRQICIRALSTGKL